MATILLMTPFSKKCCNLIQSFSKNAINKKNAIWSDNLLGADNKPLYEINDGPY